MAQITHLVRTRQNTHGEIVPINSEYCPFYKETGVRNICYSEAKMCEGIKGQNVIKELGNLKFLLECKYME